MRLSSLNTSDGRWTVAPLRALATLMLVALIVPGGGWSRTDKTPATLPAQPKCSAADTRRSATLAVHSGLYPIYLRYCGPARAALNLDGTPYTITGGHCARTSGGESTELVSIGLITNRPAASGLGILLRLPARAGRTRIDDSEIEVPGRRVAASGTVIIGTDLKSGTFTLYGRTAAGPTGEHVTGSWACG